MSRLGRFASIVLAAFALCFAMAPSVAFADGGDDLDKQELVEPEGNARDPEGGKDKTIVSTSTEQVTVTSQETGDDGTLYDVVIVKDVTTTVYSDDTTVVTEKVVSETRTAVVTDTEGLDSDNDNSEEKEQVDKKDTEQASGKAGVQSYQVHYESDGQSAQMLSAASVADQSQAPVLSAQAVVLQAQASATAPNATITFRTHVQNIGWQGWRNASASNGNAGKATAGTSGRALRLEAIQIKVKGISGSVIYQVHVQNVGWQAAQSNGASAGTSGQGLRLEAIRIALTGEISQWYDIEYRTHVQNVGWQGFVRNGAVAGTSGRGLRLEALEIRLVPKSQKAASGGEGIVGVRGQAHVQNDGTQGWVRDGSAMGTSGRSLRMESIRLQLDKGIYSGNIEYRTHVQNIGWQGWKRNGQLAGTTGRSLRMEALQVRLTGNIAKYYEVVYRAHVQNVGWQDWVSGNNIAGTTGRSLRVEALEVMLIPRPSIPTPERTVDDGLYTLNVLSSQGYAVGTAGASNGNGANVQLVPNANWRLEEKWQITWKGNGYELLNINSAKVLTALNGNKNMVANVGQANRDNSKAQRWAIQRYGGGYMIVGMNFGTVLNAQSGVGAGSNLNLWSPNGSAGQRYAVNSTEPFYAGTYQMFTKLDQGGKSIDAPNGTLANNARMTIGVANDGPNQHLIFTKSGDGYTVQVVSSGKFLTGSGSNVVQSSRNDAASQVWIVSVAASGGLVFTNVATGKILSVEGSRNVSGAVLQQIGWYNVTGQKWYPVARSLVSNGLYELRTAPANNIILDVNGASLSSGANAKVQKRNGGNNQKFSVTAIGNGYYRISMPLSRTVVTVQGSSKANGANVRMENWGNYACQQWKPVVTDGGLMFVNKGSGQALSFTSASSGANVRQTTQANSSLQKWSVVKTALNAGDMNSYLNVIRAASGSGSIKLNNVVPGYSISKAKWNNLMNALNACYATGADVSFLMVDCDTGMSLSLDPDEEYFGACTIKALYVTYLFEEYLERGRLSWGEIRGMVEPAILYSQNDPYHELRDNYGSEGGFEDWLNEVGVGYYGKWGTYSPRTLAKAWTHIMEYAESGGKYSQTWKNLFSTVHYSPIHDKLGGYRTTYSKTGWMHTGSWCGAVTNDGGFVVGPGGRKYILTIMTSVEPDDRYLVRNVIGALDAIHAEMPGNR